jgi:carbonic anhydrase/acetyltransferase-like protein (isoleucine patch superfamily)
MSIEPNAAGDYPVVSRRAYVHTTATLIGKVVIEEGVFVGPYAVLRADEFGPKGLVEPIIVGQCANVQDCVVVHAVGGTGVEIGPRTSVAHGAVVHGPCKIGVGCFVGFNSVVFRATLGDGVIVMHQALVEGVAILGGLLVSSLTAVRCQEDVICLPHTPPEMIAFVRKVTNTNVFLAREALMREVDRQEYRQKQIPIPHSRLTPRPSPPNG